MIWAGKAVGGLLGLFFGGAIGSAVGILVGHQFDRGLAQRTGSGQSQRFASERIQAYFFEATFAVMGHIAKSDGRVSETEIRAARLVMHGMKLSPAQVTRAVEHFTAGKKPGYPLDDTLDRLRRQLHDRADLTRAFVEIQMRAAVAAGAIDRTKREALWQVARALGLGRVELAQIEALVRAQQARVRGGGSELVSLEEAYRVLGVESGTGDQEVKTAYRRLMNQHHPDKLVSRGLPKSMIGVAEQKTQEIRAAYERIKTQRGFK